MTANPVLLEGEKIFGLLRRLKISKFAVGKLSIATLVVFTMSQAAQAGTACDTLLYSPPVQDRPRIVNVPTSFFSGRFGASEDILFRMPGHARFADFESFGGRHIQVVGGMNSGDGGGRMIFSQVTGSVYLEGLRFQMTSAKDVINVSGAPGSAPDVFLQNIYVSGARGSFGGNHTDIFQATGPIGALRIHRLSGDSNYQGLFLPGEFPQASARLSCIDLRYNDLPPYNPVTYLAWFYTTDESAISVHRKLFPITVSDFYVRPRSGQNIGCCSVWPPRGETLEGRVVGAIELEGGAVSWPNLPIEGVIIPGVPPNGRYVQPGGHGPGLTYQRE